MLKNVSNNFGLVHFLRVNIRVSNKVFANGPFETLCSSSGWNQILSYNGFSFGNVESSTFDLALEIVAPCLKPLI